MFILIDCNGYAWQLQDHYWHSTRRYSRDAEFYIQEVPYTDGPIEFIKQYGPLKSLDGKVYA